MVLFGVRAVRVGRVVVLLVFRNAQHSEQLVHDFFDFDFVLEDDLVRIDSGVEPDGSSKKDRRELQADIGAGYLLMPTEFILNEWRNQFGENAGPKNVYDEIKEKAEETGKDPRDVRDSISIEFANIFEVPPYAMQIRLRNMKLLEVEEAQPTLF